jgi:hypothetical protein
MEASWGWGVNEGLLFLKKKKQKDFCSDGALAGAPRYSLNGQKFWFFFQK